LEGRKHFDPRKTTAQTSDEEQTPHGVRKQIDAIDRYIEIIEQKCHAQDLERTAGFLGIEAYH
jgi:hypothetical protein